jgi:peptidoglycan/xylan/chitin deacetylase (PgdA/CDA1 family)
LGLGHSGAAPIALTFDDGPDPTWTPLVLDALAEARVTATFFVVAPRAERHPSLVARMRDEGHGVALHCNEHARHDTMTQEEIEADLAAGLVTLGRPALYWRTPWGVVTPATESVAREHRLRLVGWTADTQDWRGGSYVEMIQRVERRILPKAIVLMHDGVGPGATREDCAETVALVARLVALARSRGLQPSSLDELPHPLLDRNPGFRTP